MEIVSFTDNKIIKEDDIDGNKGSTFFIGKGAGDLQ